MDEAVAAGLEELVRRWGGPGEGSGERPHLANMLWRAKEPARGEEPCAAASDGSDAEDAEDTGCFDSSEFEFEESDSASSGSDAAVEVDGADLDRVALSAVSLAFLVDFLCTCVERLPGGAALSTKDVVDALIKPATSALGCAFAALVPRAVGPPVAFSSHAFMNSFSLLVNALREHYADAIEADVYVWVDILAVNQHDPAGDLYGGRALARTISQAGQTLVVLDKGARPLARLWCLYEIGCTPPEELTLLTPGDADPLAAFRAVNVAGASCFDPHDEVLIRSHIVREHGSLASFERMLRLRLLLKPMSYHADRLALEAASAGDSWRFGHIREFLHDSTASWPRLVFIAAGAGSGKSSVAAALCGAPGEGLVHAMHFFKASDARRQDVCEIILSLAYQLALRLPAVAERLLALSDEDVSALSDARVAWKILLREPLSSAALRGKEVVLLFDALDEGVSADEDVDHENAALNLLLDIGRLGRLEGGPRIALVVTSRPLDGVRRALARVWPQHGTRFFVPSDLRADNDLFKLMSLLRLQYPRFATSPDAAVDDVYAAVFGGVQQTGSGTVDLLRVLLAARQPPSLAQLDALSVRAFCDALPGYGVLFYERGNRIHLLHASLSDWLRDPGRSGTHAVDVAAGHARWAGHLMDAVLLPWLRPRPGAAPAPPPPRGSYAYAHAVAHLDAAGQRDDVEWLLMQLPWLQETLRERGVHVLQRQLAHFGQEYELQGLMILARTLRLASCGLQGPDAAEALPAQLVGRLRGFAEGNASLQALCTAAASFRGRLAWLLPQAPSLLNIDGPLEQQLESHIGAVCCLEALPDGRLLSCCEAGVLQLWNPGGVCVGRLEGPRLSGLACLPMSGRFVTFDNADDTRTRYTPTLWDFRTGTAANLPRDCHYHDGRITALLALPGDLIATASMDKTVRIWSPKDDTSDTAPYYCLHVLRKHTRPVRCLVAVDGCSGGDGVMLRIASGGQEKAIYVWRVADGTLERTISYPMDGIRSLAAVGGGLIASGHADGVLALWDTATGSLLFSANRCRDGIEHLVVIPTHEGAPMLLASAAYKTIQLWAVKPAALFASLAGHEYSITALAAVRGSRLASADTAYVLRLWSTGGACLATMTGHSDLVHDIVHLQDGRLASASKDGSIMLWRCMTVPTENMPGRKRVDAHDSAVSTLVAASSRLFVSGDHDGTLLVWDGNSGECISVLDEHTDAVTTLVPLSGCRLLSFARDRTQRVWHLADATCELVLEGPAHAVATLALLHDGDGTLVAAGSADAALRLFTLTACAGEECGRFERMLLGADDAPASQGHVAGITALLQLPDGSLLTGSRDATMRVWRGLDMLSRVIKVHTRGVNALAALPDSHVASASYDGTIRIWNSSWECVAVLEGHKGGVLALAVLPGDRLASSGADGLLRLWQAVDADTWVCQYTQKGHAAPILTLALLHDVGILATGGWDTVVRLWDAADGSPRCSLTGHTSTVAALAALPTGTLASASYDATVRLWDTGVGVALRVLTGHGDRVTALLALPGGQLLSGSDDGTLRVWDASPAGSGTCLGELRHLAGEARPVLRVAADENDAPVAEKRPPVQAEGATLVGRSFARTYVDARVKHVAYACYRDPGGGDSQLLVAAATATGAVHCFAVVPAASR